MRRSPGEGTAFYSEAKSCWIWRTPVGVKADGKVQYKSGRAKSRAEAINKMRLAAVRKDQPKKAMTVEQYASDWLRAKSLRVRPATHLGIKRKIGTIISHVGKFKIEAVNKGTVQQLRDKLDPAKPTESNQTVSLLISICKHAKSNGYNIQDISGFEQLAKKELPLEVFSSAEIKRLIATDGPGQLICLIASGTGMRVGEITALKWSDFRADCRHVTIARNYSGSTKDFIGPPKTKNGYRTIALPEYLAKQVKEAYKTATSEWVFASPRKPLGVSSQMTIQRRYQAQCRLANVRHRRFHTFRHTHASELLQAGVPLAEVARRLGDTITTVVNTYSHWIRPDDRTPQVIDRLYS